MATIAVQEQLKDRGWMTSPSMVLKRWDGVTADSIEAAVNIEKAADLAEEKKFVRDAFARLAAAPLVLTAREQDERVSVVLSLYRRRYAFREE